MRRDQCAIFPSTDFSTPVIDCSIHCFSFLFLFVLGASSSFFLLKSARLSKQTHSLRFPLIFPSDFKEEVSRWDQVRNEHRAAVFWRICCVTWRGDSLRDFHLLNRSSSIYLPCWPSFYFKLLVFRSCPIFILFNKRGLSLSLLLSMIRCTV